MKPLILLLLLTTNSYAGIQFFGNVDQSMVTRQNILNLMSYMHDLNEAAPPIDHDNQFSDVRFNFLWQKAVEYSVRFAEHKDLENLKMTRVYINELREYLNENHVPPEERKFRDVFYEYEKEIDFVLSELIDSAMVGSSMYAGSVPV